jgi:hypothetical protein
MEGFALSVRQGASRRRDSIDFRQIVRPSRG